MDIDFEAKNNCSFATSDVEAGTSSNCSCENLTLTADPVTSDATTDDGQLVTFEDSNALMYIVVVLMFYATSMTLLMIKYIKREREEALLNYYFNEFVKRETFNKNKFVFDKRTAKRHTIMKYIDKNAGLTWIPSDVRTAVDSTLFLETAV